MNASSAYDMKLRILKGIHSSLSLNIAGPDTSEDDLKSLLERERIREQSTDFKTLTKKDLYHDSPSRVIHLNVNANGSDLKYDCLVVSTGIH